MPSARAWRNDDAAPGLGDAFCAASSSPEIFYAAGAALCLISNYLSIGVIVLIQLYYAVAPRWRAQRPAV